MDPPMKAANCISTGSIVTTLHTHTHTHTHTHRGVGKGREQNRTDRVRTAIGNIPRISSSSRSTHHQNNKNNNNDNNSVSRRTLVDAPNRQSRVRARRPP